MENFRDLYLQALGLPPARSSAAVDENLSPAYPLCLYRFSDSSRLLLVCPELKDALPDLRETDITLDFDGIWRFLFEPGLLFEPETVSAFWLCKAPVLKEGPLVRPLTVEDTPALRSLHRGCKREWEAAAVEADDPWTAGVFSEKGKLLACAGAVPFGHFGDVSVFTHPHERGKGYGRRAVAFLSASLLKEGFYPLYRAENSNAPSLRLVGSLGFTPAFTMTGARAFT